MINWIGFISNIVESILSSYLDKKIEKGLNKNNALKNFWNLYILIQKLEFLCVELIEKIEGLKADEKIDFDKTFDEEFKQELNRSVKDFDLIFNNLYNFIDVYDLNLAYLLSYVSYGKGISTWASDFPSKVKDTIIFEKDEVKFIMPNDELLTLKLAEIEGDTDRLAEAIENYSDVIIIKNIKDGNTNELIERLKIQLELLNKTKLKIKSFLNTHFKLEDVYNISIKL